MKEWSPIYLKDMIADEIQTAKETSLHSSKTERDRMHKPKFHPKIFHTEVQICFRCCHVNILQLLGFTVESELHCLIYPYLPNGSLQNKLQHQDDSAPLPWEIRLSISVGLIRAVEYLHNFGILHGNIKSSNVLLE